MNHLNSITISQFRNLDHVKLDINSRCNVLFGHNGSGKTSFLEAIYYLGLGRSFRVRQPNRIIQYDQPSFTLNATIQAPERVIPIGVERHSDGKSHAKLNHSPISSIAELAQLLPIQLIYPDGHKLLLGGSKPRRQFLDWGVFHVEHTFLKSWQRAQRAIKHRNSLLKQRAYDQTELESWNEELIKASEPVNKSRSTYFNHIEPVITNLLSQLLPKHKIEIDYYQGWNMDKDLPTTLLDAQARDKMLGYTQYGPHKADMVLTHRARPLSETLSQGQQKLVNYALKLAQGQLLYGQTKKQSIYLIDDLPAELDESKRQLLTTALQDINAQTFITGIDKQAVTPIVEQFDGTMFHVEHGSIRPSNVP